MLINHIQFEAELRKRIDARIAELKDQLAAGHCDIEQYRRTCGQIAGLIEVFDLCEDVQEQINKR